MLGAIIGDIVGSRFEFNPTNDYNFELFTDECSFTDDTICTIAVADALLKRRDYGESIHEWCRRYPHPMGGYGNSFRKWVESDHPQPYNSFGNGSAMRVSPIGMWFENWEDVYREAEKSAACSHNHEWGIRGAKAIAYAVLWAVQAFDSVSTKEEMERDILDLVSESLADNDFDYEICYEDYRNKFDETCQVTVPVALDIIYKSDSFEDAIRKAVSLGGDADTLGAIVGSIAEHVWGIPEWMIGKAMEYLPVEMKTVVEDFYRECESRKTYKPNYKYKEEDKLDEVIAIMRWKLGLGNLNNVFERKNPVSPKTRIATARDMEIQPLSNDPSETTSLPVALKLSKAQMDILRYGHIPEAQEDHWFMYCDDEYIRYYRSWTGMCAYEAHYTSKGVGFVIDHIRMSHALAEFGVNGDSAGAALFCYLIAAEIGVDAESAWDNYIREWKILHYKYYHGPLFYSSMA